MALPDRIDPKAYAGITLAHLRVAAQRWDDLVKSFPELNVPALKELSSRDKAALYDLYDISREAGFDLKYAQEMVDAALKRVLSAKGNPRLTEKDSYAVVHDWILNLGSPPPSVSQGVVEAFNRVRDGFDRLKNGESPEEVKKAIRPKEKVNLRTPEPATEAGQMRRALLERYQAETGKNAQTPGS